MIKNPTFQNKLNNLYNRRASVTFRRNMHNNNDNNFSLDNNYTEFQGQDDEENKSLISNN